MLRRIRRRLENLRKSDDLREFNHTHGAASTLHKVQSNANTSTFWEVGVLNENYFQFRIALLLSENEAIYSEPSVVISTNEEGFPESPPIVEQVGAVDQTRVMVSWKSGLRNNGPVIGYSLLIRDLTQTGLKDIVKVETTNYLFDFLLLLLSL